MREFFFHVWEKIQQQAPLEPMEAIVAEVIDIHPEYHACLNDRETSLHSDFKPEQGMTNPFLHMGMHIALKEQLATNRPAGIVAVYDLLLKKFGNAHEAEHQMIECLAESLWQAQRDNRLPDEQAYLECLRRLS